MLPYSICAGDSCDDDVVVHEKHDSTTLKVDWREKVMKSVFGSRYGSLEIYIVRTLKIISLKNVPLE
jgi:hypothetical protein